MTTQFTPEWFEEQQSKLSLNPDKAVESYQPLRIPLPDPQLFQIMVTGQKGAVHFNPSGMIQYLRACNIIYTGGTARMFDGRIYTEMDPKMLGDMVYRAIERWGSSFIPSQYDVANVLRAASALIVETNEWPDAEMGIPYSTLDGGHLIAFENGILNTGTMDFLPFTPYVFLTSYIHAKYDPSVRDCSAKAIIDNIINTPETRDFFYEMMGFILYEPNMYPPSIFAIYGPGNTGKSALERCISTVLGSENVSRLSMTQITDKFGTAELEGKKLNVCGETGDSSSKETHVDGELMKRLSDGDTVMVQRKHQQPYYIRNTAKFLFCTNGVPDFGDNSSGLYRRLYVIPCRNQQDPTAHIYDYLTDDQSRSWLVNRSLSAYRLFVANNRQFSISPQMQDEHRQFQTQDGFFDFIQALFGTMDREEVAKAICEDEELRYAVILYERYADYSRDMGSRPLSRKKFTEKVRNEFNLQKKTTAYKTMAMDKPTTKEIYCR